MLGIEPRALCLLSRSPSLCLHVHMVFEGIKTRPH
jgi:hypothetical protein